MICYYVIGKSFLKDKIVIVTIVVDVHETKEESFDNYRISSVNVINVEFYSEVKKAEMI